MAWSDIEGVSLHKKIEAVRPRTFTVGKHRDAAPRPWYVLVIEYIFTGRGDNKGQS
jgi:hypothetical protein